MLRVIVGLAAAALFLLSTGCDKVKELNIAGNIAGKIVNADGSSRGYVSVVLLLDGAEVQRQNAEDSGNFFFTKVPGGTYTIRVLPMGGGDRELPSEPMEIKLGAGKTKQVEIKLLPEEPRS